VPGKGGTPEDITEIKGAEMGTQKKKRNQVRNEALALQFEVQSASTDEKDRPGNESESMSGQRPSLRAISQAAGGRQPEGLNARCHTRRGEARFRLPRRVSAADGTEADHEQDESRGSRAWRTLPPGL